MSESKPMLTGIRVLDITQIVAGPTAGRILAEMGAEVIKVELAPGGDRTRAAGLKPLDGRGMTQSTYFVQHNHSKKCLAVDLKQARGRALVRSLAEKVDVVIENFAPGVMARAELAYEDLKPLNPRLVMCSISLAGQSGPLSAVPGYDYMAAAYAGITAALGYADRAPVHLPLAIGDAYAGVAAAMAIGFALLHRLRTGEGQYIDTSLIDGYFHMQEANIPRVSLGGGDFAPRRTGALNQEGGPTGIFRCPGGTFAAIAVLPHQWPQLVRALKQPALMEDARFATPAGRRDHAEALRDILETWLLGFPSREAALLALAFQRVPCAPVLSLNDAMAEPHWRARGTLRRIHDSHIGAFDVPGLPVHFSRWPARRDLSAELLGESNEAVLRDLGGLSTAEIRALYAEGVLVRDPFLGEVRP
jgi:CoA:oxalate CoA-transferase